MLLKAREKHRRRLWPWPALAALGALVTCQSGHHFDAADTAVASLAANATDATLSFSRLSAYDITANETLKIQGIGRKQLQSLKLQSFTVRIAAPSSGQDISFLGSVDVYALRPGGAKTPLAHGDTFAAGLTLVGLDVQDVELVDDAKASDTSTLQLTVEVTYTGSGAGQSVVLEAMPTFTVSTTPSQTFCNN